MNSEQQIEFQKAQQLAKKEKWREAATMFLDLRDQVDDDELSMWASKALYYSEQYKLAYQVAMQIPQTFNGDLELLVKIGLKAQHFISTRSLVLRQSLEQRQKLLPLVEKAEAEYGKQFKTTVQDRLRSFYHLGDYPLPEQRKRLMSADQLPLPTFLIGARFLLRDPFTQPLVRADILNILQQIRLQEPVKMLWIDDQEYEIIPADLPVAYLNPVIKECQKILVDRFEQSDPQILRALQMQLDLQSILLNPLIDKIISDPAEWVAVMAKRATTGEYSGKNEYIIHWQQKLNGFIDKLQ